MKDTSSTIPSTSRPTAEAALQKFIGDAGTSQLHTDSLIRQLVQLFLESYVNGKTRRSLSAFYSYLAEEFDVSFSYDSLRRYCKRHYAKLWHTYKEIKNGQI